MGLLEIVHEAEVDLFRSMNLAGTNSLLDSVMLLFTLLGISYVIVLICIPLWFRGKKNAAFDAVVLVVIATIASEALKFLIDRPRPLAELEGVRTLVSASGPSFPSAHATRAFAAALLVYSVEPRKFGLSAMSLAALVSISRVYLGLHWPTDVLAGAMLGVALAEGLEGFASRSDGYQSIRRRTIGLLTRKRR